MSDDRRYKIWARHEADEDWHRRYATPRKQEPRANLRNWNGTKNRYYFKGKAAKDHAVEVLRDKGYKVRASLVKPLPAPVSYPNATHYSRHFTRKELDCHCGCHTPLEIQARLHKTALYLEQYCRKLGSLNGVDRTPVGILSGYRCPTYNKKVHGAIASQHLTGKAADLAVPAGKQAKYVRAAKMVPAYRGGGIGVYPNGGVHVDWRGWIARWNWFIGQ